MQKQSSNSIRSLTGVEVEAASGGLAGFAIAVASSIALQQVADKAASIEEGEARAKHQIHTLRVTRYIRG